VVARADLVLRSLRDTLDESVLLAKVSGLHATYLLVFEPTHPLRFLMKIGDPVRSLYATSGGKALLGSLEEREFTTWLRTANLAAMTERTLIAKPALRADITLGQQRGWYLNNGESQQGVTTISAPFRWNNAVYIVTVAGPSPRIDPRLEQASGLITNVCQLLEMRTDAGAPAWAEARTA
jgi:DNA-binding IclR family transcriptional regulator